MWECIGMYAYFARKRARTWQEQQTLCEALGVGGGDGRRAELVA